MAGLAAQWLAVGAGVRHACRELALMRIGVASRAVQAVETIERAAPPLRRLVAVNAGDRDVAAGEHEPRLLMTCEIESRGMECGLVVTLFATVKVGSACKLVVVYVLVAIHTSGRLDCEYGGAPSRHMALRA